MNYYPSLIICLAGLLLYWAFSPSARADRAAEVARIAFAMGLLAFLLTWKGLNG